MPSGPIARAVVTGMGAVTPYGVGIGALWDGLVGGRPTAATIRRFDPADLPVRFACEVPDFDAPALLPRRLVRQCDPFAQYALVAGQEALASAGLLGGGTGEAAGCTEQPLVAGVDADRVAVVVASGLGSVHELVTQQTRLLSGGPDKVRPYLAIAMPLNMAGGQLAIRHGLRGPSRAIVSACASGADAIGSALDLIRSGRADVVVAGGAEAAISPVTMAGFATAGMLSRRNDDPAAASRPFDADRDGMVCGEGAAIVVVERFDHAVARGAPVLAEVAGYGASTDAWHPTHPPPGGEGAVRALRLALTDAGVAPEQVDHVNGHGTSTPANDVAETQALRTVLGSRPVPVTSTKSTIGHLLGAAGSVEAVATTLAIRDGLVPPNANLTRQDPQCDLDVVAGEARKVDIHVALSNSFGFGGHNAVLVLRRLH